MSHRGVALEDGVELTARRYLQLFLAVFQIMVEGVGLPAGGWSES